MQKYAFHLLALCSNARSLCIIAGNTSRIDVITHIPILCEEASIPYIFVPSKEDLGACPNAQFATCPHFVFVARSPVVTALAHLSVSRPRIHSISLYSRAWLKSWCGIFIPNWAGAATNSKRATSVVLVQKPKDAAAEHSEAYAEALEEVTGWSRPHSTSQISHFSRTETIADDVNEEYEINIYSSNSTSIVS
jgi:ribosomal protein L7Ae-like RNA K-turn-binding protein